MGKFMSNVLQVTDDSFDAEVLQSDLPVLVDFYADWCGPCKRMGPVIDQIAAEKAGLKVVKLNVDDNPAMSMQYRIRGIPAFKLFRDGRVVAETSGMQSKDDLV